MSKVNLGKLYIKMQKEKPEPVNFNSWKHEPKIHIKTDERKFIEQKIPMSKQFKYCLNNEERIFNFKNGYSN